MLEGLTPIDWEKFHFLRPEFLWLFAPLFGWLIISVLSIRQEMTWKKVIAPHLRKYVIRKGSGRLKIWMQVMLFISISFGVVAISGPTWKQIEVPGQELETPLVILLELSESMLEKDLQPSRLERAKFKLTDFLKADPQARAALVGFAGTAHTIIPLTRDYNLILSHTDGLSPSVMPLKGSDLAGAMTLADTLTKVTDAPGTILIITDDITEDSFDFIQNYVAESDNKIEILPMLSLGGSEVSNEVQSILSKLESLDQVTLNRLTLDNSDVELLAKRVSSDLIFTEQDDIQNDQWEDMGLLFLIPMAALLLLWFRRGWVLYLLALGILTSCGGSAKMESLWYTPDYQGQRLSKSGDFAEAANRFEDPLRKGVAFYKSGDFDQAISAFRQDTTAQGAYNLGLAFYQNGDFESAELAFGKAIELDPGMEKARANQSQVANLIPGKEEVSMEEAVEAQKSKPKSDNIKNDGMEDMGGGGQEATEEQMNDGRQEEEVATDTRTAKELDEVPDELQLTDDDQGGKVLMRKVDDDPALFLTKKFLFQLKTGQVKPRKND